MGLFDAFIKGTGDPEKDAALNRGLMAMGLQLMQAKGKLFPALGQAGIAGIGASDQMMQQQQQAKMQALQRKMVGYQLSDAERQQQLANLPGQFYRAPSSPAIDATGGMETAVEAPNNASGPGGFDIQGYMKALQGMDFNRYLQTAAALKTDKTKPVALGRDQRLINPDTGAEMVPALPSDADGSQLAKLVKEYAALPADSPMRKVYQDAITKATTHQPAATMNNYGAPAAGVDLSTGSPVFVVTNKAGEGKVMPGVRPPRTAAEERAATEAETRARTGQQMLSVMGQARELLTKGNPTGSGIGSVLDAAGRAVGVSTPGAQTAAQLEAMSGWLVANVPRMEGPQSDKDVENYKTMAGKIGMRDVPVAERLAALKSVEELQRKYAGINSGRATSAPTGSNQPVRRFNPATGKIE